MILPPQPEAEQLRALLTARPLQRAAVRDCIQALEQHQQRGTLAALDGYWELLWTSGTRQSQQFQQGVVPQQSPGRIYQRIEAAPQTLATVAKLGIAQIIVSGSFTYTAQNRLNVTFQSLQLQLSPLPALPLPLGRGAQGWLQTTYLDEQIHIERGDRGGVSVYRRTTDPFSHSPVKNR